MDTKKLAVACVMTFGFASDPVYSLLKGCNEMTANRFCCADHSREYDSMKRIEYHQRDSNVD